jgi:hypothetical protein
MFDDITQATSDILEERRSTTTEPLKRTGRSERNVGSAFVVNDRVLMVASKGQEVSGGSRDDEPQREEAQIVPRGPVEATSEARVRMITNTYGAPASREELARIGILTARLNALSPRVSQADIDVLADGVNRVEEVSSRLDALEARVERR